MGLLQVVMPVVPWTTEGKKHGVLRKGELAAVCGQPKDRVVWSAFPMRCRIRECVHPLTPRVDGPSASIHADVVSLAATYACRARGM